MRLLAASKTILAVLEICPWVPIDVIAALVGARTLVSVYQALSRLRGAGLVQNRQVRLGPLAGTRPLTLWATTEQGHEQLRAAAPQFGMTQRAAASWLPLGPPDRWSRPNVADPLRVAAARGLAAMFVAQGAAGRGIRLSAWEAPWIRHHPHAAARVVRWPAAAVLNWTEASREFGESLLVLPDLGTAPIARFHSPLRRLLEVLARSETHEGPPRALHLVIVATSVDGDRAREIVWTELLERLRREAGLPLVSTLVFDWHQVHRMLEVRGSASLRRPSSPGGKRQVAVRGRKADDMLDLLGRHPFLTITQLAALIAVTQRRARELRQSLIAQGLVRQIPATELAIYPSTLVGEQGSVVADLAELTAAGRRHLARRLGLPVSAARRHHGLFGGSPKHRRRALRHFAHTAGVNEVFVQLALAARAARAGGADDALEEWRPAAACERWRCKPDGYGCYRRGDARYGFLLEYDRGTERATQYDAKLAAYYAYRNSGQAGRDYAGLPLLLFVTTTSSAEARILAAASRAYHRFGGPPLAIRVTTMDRIAADSAGMLGSIWTRPQSEPPVDH